MNIRQEQRTVVTNQIVEVIFMVLYTPKIEDKYQSSAHSWTDAPKSILSASILVVGISLSFKL